MMSQNLHQILLPNHIQKHTALELALLEVLIFMDLMIEILKE